MRIMTKVLHVSKSGYYAWLKRPDKRIYLREVESMVRDVWTTSERRYGIRRVYHTLRQQGTPISFYRVKQTMHVCGMFGVQPRTKIKTTIADPHAKERPDLIHRDFESPVPTYKLVGDITYLKTAEGWLYLATVIDLNTRMVVGWAMDRHMRAELCVSALEMAYRRGYVAEGAIFHSDRGAQYTSKLLATWAKSHDVRLSVGRCGSPHDNAVAESFFSTFKREFYSQSTWHTRQELKAQSVGYIEGFYNRCRIHSAIDYQIPAERMNAFFDRIKQEEVEIMAA